MLGIPWSFIIPLIILAGCTFVFSFVFNVRWVVDSGSKGEFVLALFFGLMAPSLVAECLHRAPRLVINNVNYVKNVAFPLKLLSWIVVGSTLFHLLVNLAFLCTLPLVTEQVFHLIALYLPLILLSLVAMGVIWFVTSIGIYLRDTRQIYG
jgi:lipopolysaccharide transport system permease protein